MKIFDTSQRFGIVSRFLHWLMAFAFGWQFVGALCHLYLDPQNAVRIFFWTSHYNLGFLLFLAILIRGLWGLINIRHRTPENLNFLSICAHVGHMMLYALMFIVPLTALIRLYGSGHGFSPWGREIFAKTDIKNEDLVAIGNTFHGKLGFILLLLIIGHILMVLIHHFILKDDASRRMLARKNTMS